MSWKTCNCDDRPGMWLGNAPGVELGATVVAKNYSHNIGVVAPGITIIRGFIVIDAKVDGRHYTVANTHLESGGAAGLNLLRAAQAQELAAAVGDFTRSEEQHSAAYLRDAATLLPFREAESEN